MNLGDQIQNKLDQLTKPQGSLGQLERIAMRVALNQQSLSPSVDVRRAAVFAADHGLAAAGVSAFPQQVTGQMVMNFLNGGAAINVFSRQAGADFELIDCGTLSPPPENLRGTVYQDYRIAAGSKNMLHGAAMSVAQLESCLGNGAAIVQRWLQQGLQLVALGEMGIGNTSSAALLMAAFTGLPLAQCVGRGTGHDDAGLQRKLTLLQQVQQQAPTQMSVKQTAAYFAGFEIATLAGVILAARTTPLTLLVDGFIVTSAALLARQLDPDAIAPLLFAHQGEEQGHQRLLAELQAEPLLTMGLRLGEGSGAALAMPLVVNAVAMLNDMASFASAAVSQKTVAETPAC